MWSSALRQVLDCPCAHWPWAGRSRLAWLTWTTGWCVLGCPWRARGCPDLGQVRTTWHGLGAASPRPPPVTRQWSAPHHRLPCEVGGLRRQHHPEPLEGGDGAAAPQGSWELGQGEGSRSSSPCPALRPGAPRPRAGRAAGTVVLAAAVGRVPCSGCGCLWLPRAHEMAATARRHFVSEAGGSPGGRGGRVRIQHLKPERAGFKF